MSDQQVQEIERRATESVVDASAKALFGLFPLALLRLMGSAAQPMAWRWGPTAINLPEMRADQVLVVTEEGVESALYLEYQLQPRADRISEWFTKCGGLTRQLRMDVCLVVVYLTRGDRATFPDRYVARSCGQENTFVFPVIRLWEHRDRIASGELPELAPLLVLCEDEATEETVRQEIALIRQAAVSEEDRRDLFALALRLAGRQFARQVLEVIFREEIPGMQGATIIDDWIEEGRAEGRADEARWMALRVVEGKFGAVPAALAARIDAADIEWCERLVEKALVAGSLEQALAGLAE